MGPDSQKSCLSIGIDRGSVWVEAVQIGAFKPKEAACNRRLLWVNLKPALTRRLGQGLPNLFDKEHLFVGGQRPEIVSDFAFQGVSSLANAVHHAADGSSTVLHMVFDRVEIVLGDGAV